MKLYSLIFVTVSVLFSSTLTAQNKETHYEALYTQAKQYGDVSLATAAVNNLILLGKTNYKDTLVGLYTNNGLATSGYLLGKELLKANPKKPILLEYMFNNAAALGRGDEAIAAINELIVQDVNNIVLHYQKCLVLVKAAQWQAVVEAADAGLAIPVISKQIKVEGIKGNEIAIPIQAALHQFKGVAYYNLNKPEEADKSLVSALQLAPEYKLALDNREALQKQKKS